MTFAVTSIDPIVCGWTTTPTVASEPPMRVPIRAVSVPPDSVAVPWLGVAETKLTVLGSMWVSVTPVAAPVPRFWMANV